MPTVSVVFGKWHHKHPLVAKARASEAITSGVANVESTNTGTKDDDFVEVSVSGGAVWIKVGPTGPASSGDTFLLPDGTTRHFDAGTGTKVNVIDV